MKKYFNFIVMIISSSMIITMLSIQACEKYHSAEKQRVLDVGNKVFQKMQNNN